MKSLNLMGEVGGGQSLKKIGQEVVLNVDTGVLSHTVDRQVVVDSTTLVVELLKIGLHPLQVFEDKEEWQVVKVLRDMIIIKLKEVATSTKGEGRGEVGGGDLARIIITEGEEVRRRQLHSIGAAVKLVQEEDKGIVVGGEGERVEPLIIDQEVVGTTRGPEVMHSCSHTFMYNIAVMYKSILLVM